jgi:4-hydroxy-2-oxoheptanedioate aldolase
MVPNRVKQLWQEGKPAAGVWISTGNTYVAEVLAHAGFDWAVVDMQHGMGISAARAIACFQAMNGTETVPLARVPWNDPIAIQHVLDAGCYGVIVPMVNSYEEAVRAAGACRYAPLGYRSSGPNRARLLGPDYMQRANEELICLVMIETVEALRNLDEICQAPGIDGVYIGPSDLAVSMGLPTIGMDNKHPDHVAAVQHVLDTARRYGVVAGMHCGSAEEVVRRFEQGFQFCPVGSDINFIAASAAEAVKTVRDGAQV